MKKKKKKAYPPGAWEEFVAVEALVPIHEGEGEPDGKKWLVTLIKAGLSKNKNYYPQATLEKAAPLFEGVKAYDRSDEEHAWGMGEKVRNIVGWFAQPFFEAGQIKATFHIMDTASWLSEMLLEMHREKRADLFGLSIVAAGEAKLRRHEGQDVRWVESLTEAYAVDPVVNPAAGGRFIRLAAADISEEELTMLKRLIEQIRTLKPQLLEGKDLDNITEDEVMALLAEATKPAPPAPPAVPEVPAADPAKIIAEAEARIQRVLQESEQRLATQSLVTKKLAESNLPAQAQDRVRVTLAGQIADEAKITEAIKFEQDYLASITPNPVNLPSIGLGIDSREKRIGALDAFFLRESVEVGGEKIKPPRSIKALYQEITGDVDMTGLARNAWRLRENSGNHLLAESLISTDWAQILGDSITRKMLKDYATPGVYQDWRRVVSDIVPITDFRSNKRMRMGGYGALPAVAEQGNYLALTSPTDEEAYYSISKRGGTEDVTLETIANDDVGAVRRIPTALARTALITLYRFVFDFFVNGSTDLTTYDGVAWFSTASTRYNASTTALAQASIDEARVAMRTQAAYGESRNILGLTPRTIIVPNELETTAFKLCQAAVSLISAGTTESSDMPNINQKYSMDYIVVDYLTNAKDHWFVCNPMDCPTIELGFFQGREDPELFVQDMPNIGSMFNADKLTYKIRHIYGGAPLDHRGVYYQDVA